MLLGHNRFSIDILVDVGRDVRFRMRCCRQQARQFQRCCKNLILHHRRHFHFRLLFLCRL
jgi:hypothetical protein